MDNQDEEQPSADVFLPKSAPSPTVPKTTVSSSTMLMDGGDGEEQNPEGLQSTSAPSALFAHASPGTSSDPTVSQDVNATLVLELDSRPQSPEPMEEDKEQLPSPATPKQDQTTVLDDGDPTIASASETVDAVDAEGAEASQAAAAFGRETRQNFHFGSYERDKQVEGVEVKRLALSGEPDASATISLVPTLPSPMSRPEKKTYCCAECGKEYASRSGLKVGRAMSALFLH